MTRFTVCFVWRLPQPPDREALLIRVTGSSEFCLLNAQNLRDGQSMHVFFIALCLYSDVMFFASKNRVILQTMGLFHLSFPLRMAKTSQRVAFRRKEPMGFSLRWGLSVHISVCRSFSSAQTRFAAAKSRARQIPRVPSTKRHWRITGNMTHVESLIQQGRRNRAAANHLQFPKSSWVAAVLLKDIQQPQAFHLAFDAKCVPPNSIYK